MLHDAFQAAALLSGLVEAARARRVLRIGAAGACDDAVTVYLPGCNLGCVHCWAGPDREDPVGAAPLWPYATLRERLRRFHRQNRLAAASLRIRLSGGEPILSERFFDLLETMLGLPGRVFVETNGVVLGGHPEWGAWLARLRQRVTLKVSLKAGTAEQFERLTGASREAWESSWTAVQTLLAAGACFDLNALTLAAELFTAAERAALLERLTTIDRRLVDCLEEERLTAYPGTARRMRAAR